MCLILLRRELILKKFNEGEERNFPRIHKLQLHTQFTNDRGCRRSLKIRETALLLICGNILSVILAGRLRDLLINTKALPAPQLRFLSDKRTIKYFCTKEINQMPNSQKVVF